MSAPAARPGSRRARGVIGRLGAAGAVAALLACAGCVTVPTPTYQVSVANQIALSKLPRSARFEVAAGSDATDAHTWVRAMRFDAPDHSWVGYLTGGLHAELASAGLYASAAPAALTVSLNDVQLLDGHADLTGHFVLSDRGAIVYDKVLVAHTHWDTHFIGTLAAQDALLQATAIFQTLLGQLFADPEFVAASRRAVAAGK